MRVLREQREVTMKVMTQDEKWLNMFHKNKHKHEYQ